MKTLLFLISITQSTLLFSQSAGSQKISYSLIASVNNTFGYEIYVNGQKMISQKSIPCLQGNNGFAQKSQAEAVAKLVIKKISDGQMPPSITVEELKKLKTIPQ